jgi:hypothetical protein
LGVGFGLGLAGRDEGEPGAVAPEHEVGMGGHPRPEFGVGHAAGLLFGHHRI